MRTNGWNDIWKRMNKTELIKAIMDGEVTKNEALVIANLPTSMPYEKFQKLGHLQSWYLGAVVAVKQNPLLSLDDGVSNMLVHASSKENQIEIIKLADPSHNPYDN